MSFDWDDTVPEPGEYVGLRTACGLGLRTLNAARAGLPGTLFAVTLRQDGKLVGMGRIVGDGGCFAQVVDIAVHPDQQGRGLGAEILRRLMDRARRSLPESCYISLIAEPRAVSMYRRAGFELQIGMGTTL